MRQTTDHPVSPVRARIFQAGKTLFAQSGYDSASTAAIARTAGSSESQLIKYFGGKQGLLSAIFDEGWSGITGQIDQAIQQAPNAAAKLGLLSQTVVQALERDPELKLLFLVEGRRLRSAGANIAISNGFLQFIGRMDAILGELRDTGQLRANLHPQAVRSALVGMMEGLLRDHFMAQKTGYPATYSMSELPPVLSLVMQSFLIPGEHPDERHPSRTADVGR